MINETAIKLVRDACSKQAEDGKFVLYEQDIELIAQAFNYAARAEALEEAAKVCEEGTAYIQFQSTDCYSYAHNRAAAIRGLK